MDTEKEDLKEEGFVGGLWGAGCRAGSPGGQAARGVETIAPEPTLKLGR